MNAAAEKDIRSALRQLRGCRGRLAMARTAPLEGMERAALGVARGEAEVLEKTLLALLGAEVRP